MTRIAVIVGEETLSATLDDTPAGRDFASLLPLDLTLRDYHGIEKISDLPRRLDVAGAPKSYAASPGDITFYAPWGHLAIFYRSLPAADGLVRLGSFEGAIDALLREGPSRLVCCLRAEMENGTACLGCTHVASNLRESLGRSSVGALQPGGAWRILDAGTIQPPSDSMPFLRSNLRFAPPRTTLERRADGTALMRSPMPLGPYARCIGEWLERWAREAPERTFLAERTGEAWRRVSYRDALDAARRIGEALLERGLTPARPVVVLSDNGVDHALLALGTLHAGLVVAPVSPAYSLASRDFAKLKGIFELLQPGLVWTADAERFGTALDAVGARATPLAELLATEPGARIDSAFAGITPDSVAKVLFTSGSTGVPKGVINTHRMMCANQQMLAQGWPFVEDHPPVVVDWLPWNHTFGGNHNFNLVLRNGGTLYVDGGKPVPGLIEETVRNLKDVSPTMYYNVPRGYDLLLPLLEGDEALRHTFFRELDVLFYAAAALPQNLWDRLERLAEREKGGRLAMLSAWGSTETSPLATQVHFHIDRAGVLGLPVAGCDLKLVPSAGGLEARVRGPHVTPGYWGRPDLTRAAFDEQGFYRTGDAVRLADPEAPGQGIVFDGRLAEDFKLSTGTWVHVGVVRLRLIAAGAPVVQDAVITGHDRDAVGALVFPSPAAQGLTSEAVRATLAGALRTLATDGGSSMHPVRLLVMSEPPSMDANEITDKGYINQRAVLRNRAALVERLYADDADVIAV